MPWIRIFKTRREAEVAHDILAEGGIDSYISIDTFESVPIQNYKVPPRYVLNVRTTKDYYKAAEYLAGKLKQKR